METYFVTPQVVFKKNNKEYIDLCSAKGLQVDYRPGAGNWITEQNLQKDTDLQPLCQWISEEGQALTSGLNIPGRFTLVSMWITKSAGGEHFAPHAHPLSFISGSYYFTASPEPVFLLSENLWQEYPLANGADIVSPLQVDAGDLVFIPSRMRHCVPEVNKHRSVLSFNAVLTEIDTCSGKNTKMLRVPAQKMPV
jgi:hypothetical protein